MPILNTLRFRPLLVAVDIITVIAAIWAGYPVFAAFWAGSLFGMQIKRLAVVMEIRKLADRELRIS